MANELVLVPDLAGGRRERMTTIPEDHRFRVAPDWVCEVLSPTTTRLDWAKKLPVYARYAVPYVWFIDPLAHTVQVMRLADEQYTMAAIFSGEERMRGEPFDAIESDCSTLWVAPPPDSSPAL